MKKLIATLVTLVVLSMAALPVAAQTRSRCSNGSAYSGRSISQSDARSYRDGRYRNDAYQNAGYRNDTYNNGVYNNDGYVYGDNRSVWQQHRDKITTAGGAVAGALLGGLIGGKKGAVIGAVTGGAGAAVYTYKIRNKNGRY
jgi:outer membrane lipoprotein SlyB